MGEMTVVQIFLDVAYPNMEAFKNNFGSVNNYMGMITAGISTACLLHTSE